MPALRVVWGGLVTKNPHTGMLVGEEVTRPEAVLLLQTRLASPAAQMNERLHRAAWIFVPGRRKRPRDAQPACSDDSWASAPFGRIRVQVRRPGGEIHLQMELHHLAARGPGLEPYAATGGLEHDVGNSPGVCAVPVVRGFARLPIPPPPYQLFPSHLLLADLQTPGNLVPANFPASRGLSRPPSATPTSAQLAYTLLRGPVPGWSCQAQSAAASRRLKIQRGPPSIILRQSKFALPFPLVLAPLHQIAIRVLSAPTLAKLSLASSNFLPRKAKTPRTPTPSLPQTTSLPSLARANSANTEIFRAFCHHRATGERFLNDSLPRFRAECWT